VWQEDKVGTILDVAFIIIALSFAAPGYHRGFVRSLVEFVGSIAAVVASGWLANRFIPIVYVSLFQTESVNTIHYALARVVAMVAVYVLLQMLVRLIAGSLDAVCRLPLLHGLNSLLGGAFGLLKGALVVFLLCAVLQLMLPFLTAKYPQITQTEIGKSCIYRYVYVNNPVYKLFQTQI
jgi:uncharacterized membrane protein required for colicin V production